MRRYALLTILIALPACRRPSGDGGGGPDLAGDSVGRYQVQATLVENECGAGHDAPSSISFVVDLRHLTGSNRGYWKLPDGPLLDGVWERGRGFRFVQGGQSVVIPTDPANGVPGCSIERTETVSGALMAQELPEGGLRDAGPHDGGFDLDDAGTNAGYPDGGYPDAGPSIDPEGALRGTTGVRITAVPGGNCAALLAVYGGPFPELPCTLQYELAGVRISGP